MASDDEAGSEDAFPKKRRLDEYKLIEMIKERPALYDPNHPKHNMRNIIDGHWCEIAEELNVSVHDIRNKWHVLRCSFNRVLKETESSKRQSDKPWPFFDAMYFIKEHMRGRRKQVKSANSSVAEDPFSGTHVTVVEAETETPGTTTTPQKHHLLIYEDGSTQLVPAKRPKTEIISPQPSLKPPDDPTELFFRSLLPDIAKLAPSKMRLFKTHVITKLMTLLDEQDHENAVHDVRDGLTTTYVLETRSLSDS